MNKIIEKYFGENRTIYFNLADIIADDQYITYRRNRESVTLAVGSNAGGEVDIGVFWKPEELEHCINHIIYCAWRK